MATPAGAFTIPPHPDVHILRTTLDPEAYRRSFDELRWTIENEAIWVRRYHPNIGYDRLPDFIVDRLALPYLGASIVSQVLERMDGLGPEASPAKSRLINHRGRPARLESRVVTR